MTKPIKLKADLDELRLAWRRLTLDRPDRAFVSLPHQIQLIARDLDTWLSMVQTGLASGYVGSPSQLCFKPKSPDLSRPGLILTLEDEVVYNFLVGRLFPEITKTLYPMQGDPDVAYQLQKDPSLPNWLRRGVGIWTEWREKSAEKLSSYSYVAIGDVSGYYDNIDPRLLASDLKDLSDEVEEIHLLLRLLQKWSHPRNTGIPQGYSASDILAKVFLHSTDRNLKNKEIVHLRYVDDFRIFCHDKLSARRALASLAELLFRRGLNFQSVKTSILGKSDARRTFEGISPIIEDTTQKLLKELEDEIKDLPPYLTVAQLLELVSESDSMPRSTLERAFLENFGPGSGEGFNTSLFHYLIYRLGKTRSRIAADIGPGIIASQPQETAHVLRYYSSISPTDEDCAALAKYFSSDDAIYDYQVYEGLRWFFEERIDEPRMLALSRRIAFDLTRPAWVRTYALNYVGCFGEKADRENIEGHLANLGRAEEIAEGVLALAQMERSRRNTLYSRLQGQAPLILSAISLAKESKQG